MLITVDGQIVELCDEQVNAFHSLTELQRGVVLGHLEGLTQREAYYRAGGKAKTDDSADQVVSRMLGDVKVKAFVDSFKFLQTAKLASVVMGREEMLERLTQLARTKIDDILTLHNTQVVSTETGEELGQGAWEFKNLEDMTAAGTAAISELTVGKKGLTIKLHNQVAVMKQIAELQGYNKPQQLELSGDVTTRMTLSDFYATNVKS